MNLLTDEIEQKLLKNGSLQKDRIKAGDPELDLKPVVKLFHVLLGFRWLLTELDPDDHDLAFGLCDLGVGFPELSHVRLSEIEAYGHPPDLPILRDAYFTPHKTISEFAELAAKEGHIRAWYPESPDHKACFQSQ